MIFGSIIAFAAALSAFAAAVAALSGLQAAITAAFAVLAALCAALAGFLRMGAGQGRKEGQGRDEGGPPGPAALAPPPPPAVAQPLPAETLAEGARAEAREAELSLSRSGSASALRRLRFADSVLAKVPVKTEEAAFALMERLIHLRDQSARAASAASAAERESANTEAVSALASSARATIGRVRQALSEMRKHDKASATGLNALGEELKSGIGLLSGIEEITERSKLIAINMAIEAARIGEKGRGFRVIVGELRALNDRTSDFSKKVSDLLGRFRQYNESLVKSSVENSGKVAEEVERGIGEEEKAIESLLAASTSCVELSDDVSQVVRAMNVELDGILESLQFQDITRQMIEGALVTIAEAEGDMAQLVHMEETAAGREEEGARVEEQRSILLARAKTKGEKEAIQEVKR